MLLLAEAEEKKNPDGRLYNTCIVILKANNFDGIICSSHHLLLCVGPQPEPSPAQPSLAPVEGLYRTAYWRIELLGFGCCCGRKDSIDGRSK
jgi:hypothetical protein